MRNRLTLAPLPKDPDKYQDCYPDTDSMTILQNFSLDDPITLIDKNFLLADKFCGEKNYATAKDHYKSIVKIIQQSEEYEQKLTEYLIQAYAGISITNYEMAQYFGKDHFKTMPNYKKSIDYYLKTISACIQILKIEGINEDQRSQYLSFIKGCSYRIKCFMTDKKIMKYEDIRMTIEQKKFIESSIKFLLDYLPFHRSHLAFELMAMIKMAGIGLQLPSFFSKTSSNYSSSENSSTIASFRL